MSTVTVRNLLPRELAMRNAIEQAVREAFELIEGAPWTVTIKHPFFAPAWITVEAAAGARVATIGFPAAASPEAIAAQIAVLRRGAAMTA
jgi:hypothetical protein